MTFALGTIREPQSGQSRLKTRFCDRYAEWRKLRWNLGRNAVNPQLTRKQSHQSTIWNPSPLKKSPLDKFQIVIISNKSINWISSRLICGAKIALKMWGWLSFFLEPPCPQSERGNWLLWLNQTISAYYSDIPCIRLNIYASCCNKSMLHCLNQAFFSIKGRKTFRPWVTSIIFGKHNGQNGLTRIPRPNCSNNLH